MLNIMGTGEISRPVERRDFQSGKFIYKGTVICTSPGRQAKKTYVTIMAFNEELGFSLSKLNVGDVIEFQGIPSSGAYISKKTNQPVAELGVILNQMPNIMTRPSPTPHAQAAQSYDKGLESLDIKEPNFDDIPF